MVCIDHYQPARTAGAGPSNRVPSPLRSARLSHPFPTAVMASRLLLRSAGARLAAGAACSSDGAAAAAPAAAAAAAASSSPSLGPVLLPAWQLGAASGPAAASVRPYWAAAAAAQGTAAQLAAAERHAAPAAVQQQQRRRAAQAALPPSSLQHTVDRMLLMDTLETVRHATAAGIRARGRKRSGAGRGAAATHPRAACHAATEHRALSCPNSACILKPASHRSITRTDRCCCPSSSSSSCVCHHNDTAPWPHTQRLPTPCPAPLSLHRASSWRRWA